MTKFTAKTFHADVKRHADDSVEHLQWLVMAYHWARGNETSILKYNPEYTHGWLQAQIVRVFNVSVEHLLLTCTRLGGGNDATAVETGAEIVCRIGVWECIQAEKQLTTEGFDKLLSKLTPKITTETFRVLVKSIRSEEDYVREQARIEAAKIYRQKQPLRSQRTAYSSQISILDLEHADEVVRLTKLLAEKDAEIARLKKALRVFIGQENVNIGMSVDNPAPK